jgi:uncharacterized protein YbbC (DUF1343 family)
LHDNQRLASKIKELEENVKKMNTVYEERIVKSNSSDKFSIQKIKEQYAESLKQFEETVAF